MSQTSLRQKIIRPSFLIFFSRVANTANSHNSHRPLLPPEREGGGEEARMPLIFWLTHFLESQEPLAWYTTQHPEEMKTCQIFHHSRAFFLFSIRMRRLGDALRGMDSDGLNSLQYNAKVIENRLYTLIRADLPYEHNTQDKVKRWRKNWQLF